MGGIEGAAASVEVLHLLFVESREREATEREKRLHSPFALHTPIQWAI